jgi:DNA-binding transcriptional MerR regulator
MHVPAVSLSLLKVGDLARRTNKTVRAIHLYEELGLLAPVRSKGGYRLYPQRSIERVEWIQKLQDMGLSLAEIRAFLEVWERSATAPGAMATVREIFVGKLRETRETILRLQGLARDLEESLAYLESCRSCEPEHTQQECGCCDLHGHEGKAPLLVDGITNTEAFSQPDPTGI